jgi:Phage baseplate assembly protein W
MATTTRKEETYSDFKSNIDPHPIRRDLVKITNADAITRSVRSILLTNQYERFGQPEFGAGLQHYLFENVSRTTEGLIRDAIIQAIGNYEPRANIIEVYVSARPDDNAYAATVVFSVVSRLDPVTLNVLLERIR